MLERYYPDLFLDKVQDIDLEELNKKGIKGLVLDIDNTLVPHGKEADDNAVAWVERVKASGFKVCIVSNASEKRVIKFNERLQINAFHRAAKPGSKVFLKAIDFMRLLPKETAMVGDQIFTDILGGKRLGMFTILVNPIDSRELFYIKFKRILERYILARYNNHMKRARP